MHHHMASEQCSAFVQHRVEYTVPLSALIFYRRTKSHLK